MFKSSNKKHIIKPCVKSTFAGVEIGYEKVIDFTLHSFVVVDDEDISSGCCLCFSCVSSGAEQRNV